MKKVKTIVPIALACTTIIAFFSLGATISYLTDAEAKDNIITIGNVALEIDEPSYQDSSIVAAGDSLTKNPIITNTGTKDEYVFFRVGVPKREVTLLYEAHTEIGDSPKRIYEEGTPTENNRTLDNNYNTMAIVQKSDEIYKIIADGIKGTTSTAVSAELTDNAEPKASPQLDFSYNKGDNTEDNEKEGWIYLSRELNQKITKDSKDYYYDYYYFGYNKKLAKDKSTVPLFDRIQLKSFIDEEVNSKVTVNEKTSTLNEDTKITIDAYGIQADSLGGDLNSLNEFVGQSDLQKIFNIVKEKKG